MGQFEGLLTHFPEALEAYRMAHRLDPSHLAAEASIIHAKRMICDWTDFAADNQRIIQIGCDASARILPFIMLFHDTTESQQKTCAVNWASALVVDESRRCPARTPAPSGRRLRLGYLGGDFHQHPGAMLIAELIERHDRTRFEVIAYATNPDDGSAIRRRLECAFDRLVDLQPRSDDDSANLIFRDEIDILIDFSGATDSGRPGILARRPAPIQVNYLGYPGTMGADFIDYIIADGVCIPPGHDEFYTEKVIRLDDCYQPNDTKRKISDHIPSRDQCGLPDTGFVFCAFNNSYKLTPTMFAVWMRLLKAVSGSVLWLLEVNRAIKDNLRREAAACGVDPDRLIFAPRLPLSDHLARHRLADLYLDALPYNGHTTVSDALWAELPVLTCAGETFAGRVAGSLLTALNLPELITHSLSDYEATALRLARTPLELHAIQDKIRRNRTTAPLFDIGRYTGNLERAYMEMWTQWCAGT